jgi:uncharacterized protein (TIGR00251 family)
VRWSDCYDVRDDGVVLHVHVQPSAGRTAIVGRHGHAVKVRVAAPPVDDRANDAIVALLAGLTELPAAKVEVVSGGHSRSKRVRLAGLDADALEIVLDTALTQAGGPRPPTTSGPGRG